MYYTLYSIQYRYIGMNPYQYPELGTRPESLQRQRDSLSDFEFEKNPMAYEMNARMNNECSHTAVDSNFCCRTNKTLNQ